MLAPQTKPASAACPTRLELILDQVDTLPTLSPIAARLLAVAERDDADLSEIVRLIEADPSMAARVLSLCTRADRGLAESVTTVRRAVVMLGLDAVRSAVLSLSVYEAFRAGEQPLKDSPGFDRQGFWRFALASGIAADAIAREARAAKPVAEAAFLAGLLHPLGKLVLHSVLPRSYAGVLSLAERRQCDAITVERSVIGIDHARAGRRLAERWGLPAPLLDVVAAAGEPSPGGQHAALIDLVHAARSLVRRQHLGWSGDFSMPQSPESALARVGLPPDRTEALAAAVREQTAARAADLGLDQTTTDELVLRSIASANAQLSRLNAALYERTQRLDRLERLAAAASDFSSAPADASATDALGRIAASAARLLGEGFIAAVLKLPDSDWQLLRFSPLGRVLRSRHMPAEAATLAGAAVPAVVIGELRAHLADPSDAFPVEPQIITLTPGAWLVRAVPLPAWAREPGALAPIVALWSAALGRAVASDDARRLRAACAQAAREAAEQSHAPEPSGHSVLADLVSAATPVVNNALTVISARAQLVGAPSGAGRGDLAATAITKAAATIGDVFAALSLYAQPPSARATSAALGDSLRRAAEACGRAPRLTFEGSCADAVVRTDHDMLSKLLAELLAAAAPGCPVRVSASAEGGGRGGGGGGGGGGGAIAVDITVGSPVVHEVSFPGGMGAARARRLAEVMGATLALHAGVATVRVRGQTAQSPPRASAA